MDQDNQSEDIEIGARKPKQARMICLVDGERFVHADDLDEDIPFFEAGAEGFFGFTSLATYRPWLVERGLWNDFVRDERRVMAGRARKGKQGDEQTNTMVETQIEITKRNLAETLGRYDLSLDDLSHPERVDAALDTADALRGPVVGTTCLYEHPHAGGSFIPLPLFLGYPWLSNLDRAVSSVWVSCGRVKLYQNLFWSGPSLTLRSTPFWWCPTFYERLDKLRWDNRARSAYHAV